MRFDPLDWLVVARNLLEEGSADGKEEARLRTAMGRAYYAAFWQARRLMRLFGADADFTGEDSHNRVWEFWRNYQNQDGDTLQNLGQELKRRRTGADYHARRIVYYEALNTLSLADEIVDVFARIEADEFGGSD